MYGHPKLVREWASIMETQEQKLARAQGLLREVFALLNDVAYTPNIRQNDRSPDLALLAAHVEPSPLPAVLVAHPVIPPAPEEVE